MEIASQTMLRSMDPNPTDRGLTYGELKSFDTDSNGKLSQNEVQLNARDLYRVNQALTIYDQTLRHVPFVDEDTVAFSHAELNPQLFPRGVEGISASDVNQGGLSDCFFMAPMAGLAHFRPREIVRMITDNGDGTFRVKFPGARFPVTVSQPTAAELDSYARRGENGGTWAAVLEKAFARFTHAHYDVLKKIAPIPLPHLSERSTIDNGGLLSTGIRLLTDNAVDTDILAVTRNSTIRNKLAKALSRNKLVTASTFLGGDSSKYIGANHVYTILSFDRASDTVRIRNPYGRGADAVGLTHRDSDDDGVFTLTIGELNEYFNLIAYEE